MAINKMLAVASIAGALSSNPSEQGPKKPEAPIDTRTTIVQEAVQKAMTTDLTAMKLEDLKSKIQGGEPIVLAAGLKNTMTDAVKLPEFIDADEKELLEFYSSLSNEDRKKVDDFYNGLMKLAQNERQKKVANMVMFQYTRFIKAISKDPGVLAGYAEGALKFVIRVVDKEGFPKELSTELTKYLTLAQRADEPMKLVKAELKDVETKLEKAMKERDEIMKELAKSREELAKSREELAKSRESLEKKKAELDDLIKNLEALRKLAKEKQA